MLTRYGLISYGGLFDLRETLETSVSSQLGLRSTFFIPQTQQKEPTRDWISPNKNKKSPSSGEMLHPIWLFFNKTNGSKCGAFLFLYPAQIEFISQTIIILLAQAELQLPPHDPTDHVSPKPGSSSGNT